MTAAAGVVVVLLACLAAFAAAECTGVIPGSSPLLIRWPYILSVTDSSAIILFGTTTDISQGSVRVSASGFDNSYRATYQEITGLTVDLNLFRSQINNLKPKTEYCYNLYVNTTFGEVEIAGGLSFTTAPAQNSTETVRFVAIGDFGCGTPAQRRVRDALFAKIDQADMFLALGDDVYMTGTHFAYQRFNFEVYNELWAQTPLFLTSGNHDYYANGAQSYLENFPQFLDQESVEASARGRYFSWDWGMIHFVSIDTEQELDKPVSATGMVQWLDNDLSRSTKPWKIAILHKPPYTENRVADDRVIEKLNPLFEKHRVQAVLGGHWHDYQRFPPLVGQTRVATRDGGVSYIITGGGGFPIIGDIIPQKNDLGFSYDPKAMTHNAKDDTDKQARMVIAPDVYKGVHHYVYVEIDLCNFHLQALDSDNIIIDDFSLSRC